MKLPKKLWLLGSQLEKGRGIPPSSSFLEARSPWGRRGPAFLERLGEGARKPLCTTTALEPGRAWSREGTHLYRSPFSWQVGNSPPTPPKYIGSQPCPLKEDEVITFFYTRRRPNFPALRSHSKRNLFRRLRLGRATQPHS